MSTAALVPAFDEATCIATTVERLRSIPTIEEVIVIDDGSHDETAAIAERAGARVLRQPNRGKGAALRAGLAATDAPIIVLIDADLGQTAAVAADLLAPLLDGTADMTIASPPAGSPSGFGLVERFARWGIERLSGFTAARPLSGQRAVRREILDRFGFADRFGVEAGLTIDAVRANYRVLEVPFAVEHAKTGRDLAGFVHRAKQGFDVAAVLATRLRRTASRA